MTSFQDRHIGPKKAQIEQMLKELGLQSLEELITRTVPQAIRTSRALDLPKPLQESEFILKAHDVARMNSVAKSYIGQGYYDCHTPAVILRNILENPGWYTAYTPYQAEISQGRMEALLNFQTLIMELTQLDLANASLLDEATAAAEAMSLCFAARKNKSSSKFFVDKHIYSQTLEVLETRAEPLGIEIVQADLSQGAPKEAFALYIQNPSADGQVRDLSSLIEAAHKSGVLCIVGCDLLSLCLIKSPGKMGADVAVGSSQRFGVPMGFGGPHAAFLATRDEFKRLMPGRVIGVSKDSHGHPALRLALQTREQHIRREKATSNICTAQVLLAVMASMYAVYHGPKGLWAIAERVHHMAVRFAASLKLLGYSVRTQMFFDTVQIEVGEKYRPVIMELTHERNINLNWTDTDVVVAFDEAKTEQDLMELVHVFAAGMTKTTGEIPAHATSPLPSSLLRAPDYLQQSVFNSHHSETEMLRYMRKLEGKDLTLNHSMIPLGSCTMKLNATSEMLPVTWPHFSKIHPFAPLTQAQGYLTLIRELEHWLCELTGFSAFSLQPNAGSQGEYAGLMVIKKFLAAQGKADRNICLIPSSAHGTNPASAAMAGLKVVVVQCDERGNVDLGDLKEKAQVHSKDLAAIMITYPSTHGVFEETIAEIASIVHSHGGQVYMDGANMNALVGLCRPAEFGVDVSHLNLHKTFCIPHGGGGPGVGPIGVAKHLAKFLPGRGELKNVSAAPWGSAGILPISWAYIAMMGGQGLTRATEVAILNANYIAQKLKPHYPLLYANPMGYVAHECIIDLRPLKASAGITVDDVAKRLMDYGFHAPTMSWPVAGTLMIEPTESESKAELDRFIEAMVQIREEIADIESGKADQEDNVLKNAPHTATHLISDQWPHKYSREKAAFPLPWVRANKFWPAVGRVDNAFGDKNLVCSCSPLEEYQ